MGRWLQYGLAGLLLNGVMACGGGYVGSDADRAAWKAKRAKKVEELEKREEERQLQEKDELIEKWSAPALEVLNRRAVFEMGCSQKPSTQLLEALEVGWDHLLVFGVMCDNRKTLYAVKCWERANSTRKVCLAHLDGPIQTAPSATGKPEDKGAQESL